MSFLTKNLKEKPEIVEERKQMINKIYKFISDPKFIEMKEKLDNYHNELRMGIKNNNNQIKNKNFKKKFFYSLKSLLNTVLILKDEQVKTKKIEEIFIWFNERQKIFEEITNIKKRTSKNEYEIIPDIEKIPKNDYYEAGKYPLFFESNHRTLEEGMLAPGDR